MNYYDTTPNAKVMRQHDGTDYEDEALVYQGTEAAFANQRLANPSTGASEQRAVGLVPYPSEILEQLQRREASLVRVSNWIKRGHPSYGEASNGNDSLTPEYVSIAAVIAGVYEDVLRAESEDDFEELWTHGSDSNGSEGHSSSCEQQTGREDEPIADTGSTRQMQSGPDNLDEEMRLQGQSSLCVSTIRSPRSGSDRRVTSFEDGGQDNDEPAGDEPLVSAVTPTSKHYSISAISEASMSNALSTVGVGARTSSVGGEEHVAALPTDSESNGLRPSRVDSKRAERQELFREQGLYAVACDALKDELSMLHALPGAAAGEAEAHAYTIAVTSHPKVIETCLYGGWTAANRRDKDLQPILRLLRARASGRDHPFVYLNELADEKGLSPSPNELQEAIKIARGYYEGTDKHWAARIDHYKTPYRTPAQRRDPLFRKYLYTTTGNLSQRRIARGLAFCAHLEERLATVSPELRDEPLAVPLVEIGYSHNVDKRLVEGLEHKGSNRIMGLFDCIVGLLHVQRFRIQQFVIYACVDPDGAALAQLLFTRLNEGYIGNVGGFSYYAAGINGPSASTHDVVHWGEAIEWSLKHMRVEQTHTEERARRTSAAIDVARRAKEARDKLRQLKRHDPIPRRT
ncbi:hypothetical protein LTR86_006346 [Recurvomyces mirabilis]|nr:hypothetical protein LTR86_006346 [Recurvomyces mirabilis]